MLDEGMEIYGGENVELGIRVSQLEDLHTHQHWVTLWTPAFSSSYVRNTCKVVSCVNI